MNTTKLVICTLVGTVFVFLLDYLYYAVLMGAGEEQDQPAFLFMVLGYLITILFFCLIYGRWQRGGSATTEGLRYGIMIGFLAAVGLGLLFHGLSTNEMFAAWSDLGEVLRDSLYEVVKFGILGIIVAHLSGLHSGMDDRGGPGGKTDDPLPPPPPPGDADN